MAIHITADEMTLKMDGRVVATARYSAHAAANWGGGWIVSTHPVRLFGCNEAITALTLAERLAARLPRYRPVRHQLAR